MDEHLQPATVNNTWHNHDAPMDVDDDELLMKNRKARLGLANTR